MKSNREALELALAVICIVSAIMLALVFVGTATA